MKDRKNMVMIIIIGITISLFLCFNTTVFATTGTVITSDLRLRKEDSTSSEILTLLDENDEVEIISDNGDWYKVKANGKVGYVSKQYIKVKEENVIANLTTNEENNNTTTNTSNEVTETKNETTKTEETTTENVEETIKQVKFTSDTELKIMPLINGTVINTTKSTEKYDIISTVGVWSYVTNGSKSGWVLTEKATKIEENNNQTQTTEPETQTTEQTQKEEEEPQTTEKTYSSTKTYYVKGSSVNARSAANKSADVVKVLNTNDTVKVTGEDGDWYVVNLSGKKAYIAKSLLSSKKVETTSRSSNSLTETNTSAQTTTTTTTETAPAQTAEPTTTVASNPSGDAIVAYAKTFLGYRYVYGTAGPNTFDCSGFVQYVYKHFGYSLSRSSKTQANDGVAVSKSDLQPGDILIFKNTAKTAIGHVGIYIGNNQFIHASNSKTGVIISSLSTSAYQQRYVGARRIL